MRFLDHRALWALGVLTAALGCSGSIVLGTGSGATTSGSAGAGGTTGSSGTSSGGTGTTSGSGGTGTPSGSSGSITNGCVSATDCPAPAGPCVLSACDAATETCTTAYVAAGTPASASAQVQGDCRKVICESAGNPGSVPDDTDVPSNKETCVTYSCSAGMVVTVYHAGPCDENGGQVCGTPGAHAQGTCVACNENTDCGSGLVCQLNNCVQSTCTPSDCGGPCAPCPTGHACQTASDCQSGDCGPNMLCAAATCTDGVQNEGETDVDCGGPICRPEGELCPAGKICLIDADCQSGTCGDGTCG